MGPGVSDQGEPPGKLPLGPMRPAQTQDLPYLYGMREVLQWGAKPNTKLGLVHSTRTPQLLPRPAATMTSKKLLALGGLYGEVEQSQCFISRPCSSVPAPLLNWFLTTGALRPSQ